MKVRTVLLTCDFCKKPFMGKEPKMCCSGRDCNCQGGPIEPITCSKECEDKIMNPKKRNLKHFNHWIAEVRDLALKKGLRKELEQGKFEPLTKTDIKYLFDRSSFYGSFKDGQEPLEALEDELSYWEP